MSSATPSPVSLKIERRPNGMPHHYIFNDNEIYSDNDVWNALSAVHDRQIKSLSATDTHSHFRVHWVDSSVVDLVPMDKAYDFVRDYMHYVQTHGLAYFDAEPGEQEDDLINDDTLDALSILDTLNEMVAENVSSTSAADARQQQRMLTDAYDTKDIARGEELVVAKKGPLASGAELAAQEARAQAKKEERRAMLDALIYLPIHGPQAFADALDGFFDRLGVDRQKGRNLLQKGVATLQIVASFAQTPQATPSVDAPTETVLNADASGNSRTARNDFNGSCTPAAFNILETRLQLYRETSFYRNLTAHEDDKSIHLQREIARIKESRNFSALDRKLTKLANALSQAEISGDANQIKDAKSALAARKSQATRDQQAGKLDKAVKKLSAHYELQNRRLHWIEDTVRAVKDLWRLSPGIFDEAGLANPDRAFMTAMVIGSIESVGGASLHNSLNPRVAGFYHMTDDTYLELFEKHLHPEMKALPAFGGRMPAASTRIKAYEGTVALMANLAANRMRAKSELKRYVDKLAGEGHYKRAFLQKMANAVLKEDYFDYGPHVNGTRGFVKLAMAYRLNPNQLTRTIFSKAYAHDNRSLVYDGDRPMTVRETMQELYARVTTKTKVHDMLHVPTRTPVAEYINKSLGPQQCHVTNAEFGIQRRAFAG